MNYTDGDAGIWHLDCSECPLQPHLDALGMKGKGCAGGIATNMQGPVLMWNCPHSGGSDSLRNDPENVLTIECRHGEARP